MFFHCVFAEICAFREYLFSRMASSWKFRELLFLWIASFRKFRVYKLQPGWKKNKKKTVEQGNSANVSVKINGKTGRSWWKNCCYWLILKKAEFITNIFCAYIFSCIHLCEIWILCIFGVYLFSRMPFKENFACI